jgi:stage II sporulation protein R
MKKYSKLIIWAFVIICLLLCASLITDYVHLHRGVLRLHVVAASDKEEDQRIKLQVRDRVLQYLQSQIPEGTDKETAKQMIGQRLNEIAEISNEVLKKEGVTHLAQVSLQQEAFPKRDYDHFSLPAGIYDSLRIRIGQAQGQNWWCVIFPSLCLSATSEGLQSTAVSAGFTQGLTSTISRTEGYEIRFYLLDCIGRLENILWGK